MAGQTELQAKIAELGSIVIDLGVDIQAAFDKLKADIANGVDTQPSIDAIQASIDKLKGFDASAETESGTHTDPA